MFSSELKNSIENQLNGSRKVSFLVGAGLSAESDIPTFRDTDGYWSVGSQNYSPQQLGTKRFYLTNAHESWKWYLHRISICRRAEPNSGHIALANIEEKLQHRFTLISQNVDGLHFKAGSSEDRLMLIHGDLRYMRCGDECSSDLYPIPDSLFSSERHRTSALSYQDIQLLTCPKCGEDTRPHVLWFDEYYDEKFYKLQSSLRVAKETGLLVIVGTSGATGLPKRLVELALSRNAVVVDINPNPNHFTTQLEQVKNGYIIKQKSSVALQQLSEIITSKTL